MNQKTFLYRISRIIAVLFLSFSMVSMVFSQVSPSSPEYQKLKAEGKLPQPEYVAPPSGPVVTIGPATNTGNRSTLLIPWDDSFLLAMDPNDDESTGQITLPFNFCLYGDSYNYCWINNNGNVSFNGPVFEYSATSFPYPDYPMLAPFWADVDTRTCGAVYYKIETSPMRVTVIWQEVGYYDEHCDMLCTFELIFTDGNDPLIGVGNNVAFSYGDMTWTTGDASDGVGGFGGIPATVGVNKGDGIAYALVGRFDQPGISYDGAGGANDGVDYLDWKIYTFDACAGTVVIQTPISNWALLIAIGLMISFTAIMIRRRSS